MQRSVAISRQLILSSAPPRKRYKQQYFPLEDTLYCIVSFTRVPSPAAPSEFVLHCTFYFNARKEDYIGQFKGTG